MKNSRINTALKQIKYLMLALIVCASFFGTFISADATGARSNARTNSNADTDADTDDSGVLDGPVDGDEAVPQEGDILPIAETEPLPAPIFTIESDTDFTYQDIEFKLLDHYDETREPLNGKRISVSYNGIVYPAYYWAPGNFVIVQVEFADGDIPAFDELSPEDRRVWELFKDERYATAEEAYYDQMLPVYTFRVDFEGKKIVPYLEFDYGSEGKVVMVDYTEDQMYYLEELSPSFLKIPPFEFETYQFLNVNDDSCYHILSCMDQAGSTFLYQYDANGNSCARADLNMLIGLRYLAERTIALNEYIDKVQAYQDSIRKIIAGVIVLVVITAFVIIYLLVGRKKKHDDDEDDEIDDEDGEDEDKAEGDPDDENDTDDSENTEDSEDSGIRSNVGFNKGNAVDEDDVSLDGIFDENTADEGKKEKRKLRLRKRRVKEGERMADNSRIPLDELDKLTMRYTGSDSERFKQNVIEELNSKKEDDIVLPEIMMPEDLDLDEVSEASPNVPAQASSDGEVSKVITVDDVVAGTAAASSAANAADGSMAAGASTTAASNSGTTATTGTEKTTISLEDLDKLTFKYTASESDIFKRDIMEGLSDEGFSPKFDDEDPTEGGLYYAADTDAIKDMFRPSTKKKKEQPDDPDELPEEKSEEKQEEKEERIKPDSSDDDDEVMDLNDL